MCFVLYIATDSPMTSIAWDEHDRKLNIQDLTDSEAAVANHFHKPNRKYIGSDQGCGCGFRHVSYQNGQWPEEFMIGFENHTREDQQQNHEQLHQLLSELLKSTEAVELYGCWDSDFLQLSAGCEVLSVDRILDQTFYFRERYGYTVNQSEQGVVPNRSLGPSLNSASASVRGSEDF